MIQIREPVRRSRLDQHPGALEGPLDAVEFPLVPGLEQDAAFLRTARADRYREAHPRASVVEIASESGFGSRQTYYPVKAKLNR